MAILGGPPFPAPSSPALPCWPGQSPALSAWSGEPEERAFGMTGKTLARPPAPWPAAKAQASGRHAGLGVPACRVGSGPRPRGPRGQPCGRGAACGRGGRRAAGGGERAPNCPDLQTWPAPRRPHKSAATVSAASAAGLAAPPPAGSTAAPTFHVLPRAELGMLGVGRGREGGRHVGEGMDGQGPATLQMPVSGASSLGSPLPNGPESPLAL